MPDVVVLTQLLDAGLMLLMVATAIIVVQLRDLFSAVMLMGMFSLLSAGLFVVLDAVDVAFTEAAVGAGISTVLMLGTLAMTPKREASNGGANVLALSVVLAVGTLLLFGTQDMPGFGDPEAAIHGHVAPEYIRISREIGIPNVVTVVLASLRGYDTLGETTVVFTAGTAVVLLLGAPARSYPKLREDGTADRPAPAPAAPAPADADGEAP